MGFSSINGYIFIFICLIINIQRTCCRKHQLVVENDARRFFPLSTFGFLTGGNLLVNLTSIAIPKAAVSHIQVGFTLDRTLSDAMNPHLDGRVRRCTLNSSIASLDTQSGIIYFQLNLVRRVVELRCSDSVADIVIMPAAETKRHSRRTRAFGNTQPSTSGAAEFNNSSNRNNANENNGNMSLDDTVNDVDPSIRLGSGVSLCRQFATIPLVVRTSGRDSIFHTSFVVKILARRGEGLYSLTFHNCANYGVKKVAVNMSVSMVEHNLDSFLSAGEMQLPTIYFFMALVFFMSTLIWLIILRRSTCENVYRTHYVMVLLGLMKSLSLTFHGVNYRVIETNGCHSETWAVLFYVTHLMKGALLFVTILLLGTGWTFIKHVLSDREKKMFMIVIPMQLLANVAQIILEESEEGDTTHTAWRRVLYLVDIMCCASIIFPVVWSIRHLQEASKTDGKAVMNLKKLQLFRHFYVMIVCYIYFTRIVVYLLQIMVPFRYEWVDELFRELVTFVFFMLTSIKFQPADNNPYFQVPLCEDEPVANEVLTETGVTERVRRVRGPGGGRRVTDRPHRHDQHEAESLIQQEDSLELD